MGLFSSDNKQLIGQIGKDSLISSLRSMIGIRQFELRAEAAYQQGFIGGFFHAYIGQEAIQTSCVNLLGQNAWYTTTYRCHALALLLGVTPSEAMAELYGKATGNAKGRGGSMHLFSDKMLGGFGIVGGHVPLAAGAGFSLKYLKKEGISICYLGDGAVAQGAVHETLNLASLWDLPCVFVVENNMWGMGTGVERAISISPIAEKLGPTYGMSGYSVDGMNYLSCYGCFDHVFKEVKSTSRPVIVEAFTQRFKGHSVSDPGLYRTKEDLKKVMELDPIEKLYQDMLEKNFITEALYNEMIKEEKEKVVEAMKFAQASPDPSLSTLEEDVFCPY